MLRTALLGGNTITLDADLSKYIETLSEQGIIEGLEVSSGSVAPGKAWVKATRSNGETIMVLVQNTESLSVDTTGTKKIWLEIRQEAIDNGTLNNEDGTGIAELKTGPSVPSQNSLLLASVADGSITDERNLIPKIQSVAQRTSSLEQKMETQQQKVEKLEEAGESDQLVAKLVPNGPVKKRQYKVLCNPVPPKSVLKSNQGGGWVSQNIILNEIPNVETIYISFLLFRKVDEPVQFTFEAGEKGTYGNNLAEIWHTSTQTEQLKKEYDEVVFELPVNKIKNNEIQVLLKFESSKIEFPIFEVPPTKIYIQYYNSSRNNQIAQVVAFCESAIDFNLIGKNERPGLGIGIKQCIGVTMDEGEGIADLYMPTGDFEYKKGNFIARKFKTGSNTKVTALTFDGFFDSHDGNTNISIYKQDALGGIDISQQVFTTAIAKSQFALGFSEGLKNYYPSVDIFNQTISFDAVVELEAKVTSTYGSFHFYINGRHTTSLSKSSNEGSVPKKIKIEIKAGRSLKITANSDTRIEYCHCTISPTGSTLKHIPIDTNLEANTDYYVVIDGGFTNKSLKGAEYGFNNNANYDIPEKILSPGEWELEVKKTQYSMNNTLYLRVDGIFLKNAGLSASTNQSVMIPIVIDDYGRLEGRGRSHFQYCIVGRRPKQLHISTQAITNMTQERGCPFIGIEFEKPDPIKVILNKSVIHLENKNFTPGETYYLHRDELYTFDQMQAMNQTSNLSKFGLALTPTSILMDMAIQSTTGVITGSVPLGMPIGYVQMNGYNVPVYG